MASAIEKLYIKKIQNKEINAATEAEWTVEDVPVKWREAVRAAIEEVN